MFYKLRKTLIAAALFLLALGCKRENPNQLGTNLVTATTETNKVQQWLKGNPKALTGLRSANKAGQKVGTSLPSFTLQWAEAGLDAATHTYWVPAAFTNTKAAGGKSNTYLVATENGQGQITGGQYVMVLPNAKKMGKDNTGYGPIAMLADKKPTNLPAGEAGFSGAVLYYDVQGQLTGSQVYEAGQLQPKATANLAARDEGQGSPSPNKVIRECGEALGIPACIDWYWQTYVNGVLVEEDYMFTTCCSGSSGGGNGVSSGPALTSCERTQAQAQSIITGIQLENTNDVVTTNGQPYSMGANNPIRMPKTVRWGFLKLHLYWNYYLRYTLVYPGVVFRNNAQDNVWKWESVNNGDLHRSGEMAPCMNVQFTHTVVPPIISADKRIFSTGVSFTAVASVPCLLGAEMGTYTGGHPYAAFDANTNYAE